MLLSYHSAKRIWAVGGGKGGSGKSFITANMGIQLAKAGHRVVLLDVDLGGGNLHTYLGMPPPKRTVGDFILRRCESLVDVCSSTTLPNLKVICGPQDYYPFSNLFFAQKAKLLRHLEKMDAEIVILDLGPGTAYNVIDFSLFSSRCILIILPEPSAVENGYLFMKRLIHRKIIQELRPSRRDDLLEQWTRERNGNENKEKHLSEFISLLRDVDRELCQRVEKAISQVDIKIVLNQVRTQEDIRLGNAISYLAEKYMGIKAEFLGSIPFEEPIKTAAKRMEPFSIFYPETRAAKALEYLSRRLIA